MKNLLNKNLYFSLSFLILLFVAGCQKEIEFGEMQSNFGTEVVYRAMNDGLLTVQFSSRIISSDDVFVKVYSDNNELPTTLIGEMRFSGTMTLPIKRNGYWKVMMGNAGTISISFTPIVLN